MPLVKLREVFVLPADVGMIRSIAAGVDRHGAALELLGFGERGHVLGDSRRTDWPARPMMERAGKASSAARVCEQPPISRPRGDLRRAGKPHRAPRSHLAPMARSHRRADRVPKLRRVDAHF
jgi:hypothetical protein